MPAILSVLMSSQRLTVWQTWVFLVVEGAEGRRSFEVTSLLGFFVVVALGPSSKIAGGKRKCGFVGRAYLKWQGMWLVWRCTPNPPSPKSTEAPPSAQFRQRPILRG